MTQLFRSRWNLTVVVVVDIWPLIWIWLNIDICAKICYFLWCLVRQLSPEVFGIFGWLSEISLLSSVCFLSDYLMPGAILGLQSWNHFRTFLRGSRQQGSRSVHHCRPQQPHHHRVDDCREERTNVYHEYDGRCVVNNFVHTWSLSVPRKNISTIWQQLNYTLPNPTLPNHFSIPCPNPTGGNLTPATNLDTFLNYLTDVFLRIYQNLAKTN